MLEKTENRPLSICLTLDGTLESKGVASYRHVCYETTLYFKKDNSEARNR